MGCSTTNSAATASNSKITSRAQTKEYMSLLITAPAEVLVKRNSTFKDILEAYTEQQKSKPLTIPFNKIDLTNYSDPSNYAISYKGQDQSLDTKLPDTTSFALSDIAITFKGNSSDIKFTIQDMSGSVKIPVRCDPTTKIKVLMDLAKEILAYEDNRVEYIFKYKHNTLNEDSDLQTYNITNGDVIYIVINSMKPQEIVEDNKNNERHHIIEEKVNIDEDEY